MVLLSTALVVKYVSSLLQDALKMCRIFWHKALIVTKLHEAASGFSTEPTVTDVDKFNDE